MSQILTADRGYVNLTPKVCTPAAREPARTKLNGECPDNLMQAWHPSYDRNLDPKYNAEIKR